MQEFRGICLTNLDMRQFFRNFVLQMSVYEKERNNKTRH